MKLYIYIADFIGTLSFRLLTEYHSFLLIETSKETYIFKDIYSFRLLTEYHSFLWRLILWKFQQVNVSVSLRSIIHSYESKFILVNITRSKYVSVSLRSIIHSYSTSSSTVFGFALPMVSVSLRSIIHSYQQANTETFLILWVKFPSPYGVSFILILRSKKSFVAIIF